MGRHSKQVNLDDLARHWRCNSAHNLGSSSQAQPVARHSLPELMSVSFQPHAHHLEHRLASHSAHDCDAHTCSNVIMPTMMGLKSYSRLQVVINSTIVTMLMVRTGEGRTM